MASLRSALLALSVVAAQAAHGGASQKPITEQHGSSKNPLNSDMEEFVLESLDFWRVPGMSVGVVDGDHIYTEGYGYATLPDVRATADTLWYGASTSKAQAAALLSQLIHSHNHSEFALGWETPLSSIIRDDFVLQDEWATAHVTLNDAASHRTGLGRHDLGAQAVRGGRQLTPRDVARDMRHLAMTAEPRVQWSYCNFMYTTLGYIVETVTGQWLGDALREHLWGPLGMGSTFFDTEEALGAEEHFASGYAWSEEAGNYTLVDHMVVTDAGAAGAVISNVKDYAKWVRCLLQQSAPLSEETHRDIRKPRMLISADEEDAQDGMAVTVYGLGWMRTTIHGKTVLHHSGGMHAYGAEVFWLPEVNFGVVTFGNTAASSNWAQLDVVYRLIEDRLDIPAKQRINIRERSKKKRDGAPTREEALRELFADRPETALPSSFNASQLVGHYNDAGWGDFTFTQDEDAAEAGQTLLVGPRTHASFKHTFYAEHITGDYWLVHIVSDGNSPYMSAFFRAHFEAGTDGEPVAMHLDTAQDKNNSGDGVIVFTKSGW